MNKQNKTNIIGSLLFVPLLVSFSYGSTQIVQPTNSTNTIVLDTKSNYHMYLTNITNHTSTQTLSEVVFETINDDLKNKVKFKLASRLNQLETKLENIKSEISIFLNLENQLTNLSKKDIQNHQKALIKSFDKLNKSVNQLKSFERKYKIAKLSKTLKNAIPNNVLNKKFTQSVKAISAQLNIKINNIAKPIDDAAVEVAEVEDVAVESPQISYTHIPTSDNLTDAMAYRFLNMATFGATPKLVKELKSKGIVKWLDDQLNMEYDFDKQSVLKEHMRMALNVVPEDYNKIYRDPKTNKAYTPTIESYLADNNINFYHFDKKKGRGLNWHSSSLFKGQMEDEQQVRQRVGYALSQIVVASQSTSQSFYSRAEALSHYYDLLLKHSFGNYGDLLYDVSMTSAMSTYLTYEGNKKTHIVENGDVNITITPDENYGRELMQLFSIGLYKLNMDGTIDKVDGVPIASYDQEDVNELSRVFTGLYSAGGDAEFGSGIGLVNGIKKKRASTIHPLKCNNQWHDAGDKTVLKQAIGGSSNCVSEVKRAIEILTTHDNMAPFISKKLILRLAKSNPTSGYIYRVATKFDETDGNLKDVVRAILLDEELWSDIVSGTATKIKEPYLKLTGMLRAFDVKPAPQWVFKLDKNTRRLVKYPSYRISGKNISDILGQAPTFSPSVFNFYNDNYVPTHEDFKAYDPDDSLVAPEISIQTMSYIVKFSNFLDERILDLDENVIVAKSSKSNKKEAVNNYFSRFTTNTDPKFLINMEGAYLLAKDALENNPGKGLEYKYKLATQQVTDWLSIRLIGEKLPDELRETIISNFSQIRIKGGKSVEQRLSEELIKPLVRVIVDSTSYSVN
ncbi:MAG: DUF1800 family protein [Campylobacterota bacterium]|nr:DUF1800 family protein [Campylobacterota bacterium]